MGKKALKKILFILMITMLLATDFLTLSYNLISYAAESENATNNKNIEFATYFKNEKGERVEEITESMQKQDLKLYAELKVKNEGYFNGEIEIQNSNFKIKNVVTSEFIKNIDGNKVTLKQINYGNTVEIELHIEQIISETILVNNLSCTTGVKLTGTYMEVSYEGLPIEATRTVKLNLIPDENTEAELSTEIITNKLFRIDGTNKRIVQVLVKSRLKNNMYPIESTTINIQTPEVMNTRLEKVEIFAIETKATNGQEGIEIESWTRENENIQIVLENNGNEQSEISWAQNAFDEIIITYTYNSKVDASVIEVNASSEIQVYNSENKYNATANYKIENMEPNNIIRNEITSNITEIYKGQLYANLKSEEKKNIEYSVDTEIQITDLKAINEISIIEGKDILKTETQELDTKTKFVKTEIEKEQLAKILGDNGVLQINDGTSVYKITKDAQANEDGNIVINYINEMDKIDIKITNYAQKGKLKLKHTKQIVPNEYTTKQVRNIKELKIQNTVIGTKNGTNNAITNNKEMKIDLKETISKAQLAIDKTTLSTMAVNEDVTIGVRLITDDVRYDLYKNPTISIKLPNVVENVTINNTSVMYGDEFVESTTYNNVNKTFNITLTGEQTKYTQTVEQLYILLNVDITLSKTAPSKTDKITMIYTNENATQYDGERVGYGEIEKNIQISSINGLVTIHNTSTYGLTGIKGVNNYEQKIQILDGDSNKDINFGIDLINNTQEDMNNVKILGILPTTGNKIDDKSKNTLQTQLINVSAPNATVYFTNNANATDNIEEAENGWTSDLNTVENPKMYLIYLQSMPVETSYSASYTVRLPEKIGKDLLSYTQYKVIYDSVEEENIEKTSVIYGLETETAINIETTIAAEVGNDKIQNGDTIKAGEVIKYKATVKNNGARTINNVTLKAFVPDGTVVVIPRTEDYVEFEDDNSEVLYYEELTDKEEFSEVIPSLAPNETYSIEYEVRVKSNIENNKEISNKAIASCNNLVFESETLKNTVQTSKIRITIKRRTDESIVIVPGGTISYTLFVENLSDETEKNLEMQINLENQDLQYLLFEAENVETINGKYIISEIPANGTISYEIGTKIKENVSEITATVDIIDSKEQKNRSNKVNQELTIVDVEISMSSPQDKQYIKKGDTVEYNIAVKNTGDTSAYITIIDNISEYLRVQQIIKNGKVYMQSIDSANKETYIESLSNEILNKETLQAQEKLELKIIAQVRNIVQDFGLINITNKAEVKAYGVVQDVSEEITHILKGDTTEEVKNIISGKIWLDKNFDGIMDKEEETLSGIKVRLYDVSTNDYVKNSNGDILEVVSNENGEYTFNTLEKGKYIVLFDIDTEKYESTIYKKEEIEESKNSDIIINKITINGEEKTYGLTDTIDLSENVLNVNAGLKEKVIFDLELNKYISKITVQTNGDTKSYDYENSTFERVEIKAKQIEGALVVLEYTIKVKNNGEIAGTVNNIVDYLPNGLIFSSELNKDWYLMGDKLYTKSLENEKINPGEEKEVKLILTKTMTGDNVGLINNSAEIYQSYNELGNADIDSKENNQVKEEDDYGYADVIIGISTGGTTIIYTILVIINTILIAVALYMIIKNKRLPIKF